MGQEHENYEKLIAKVDQKFAEISSRYPRSLKCGRSCHSCCIPELSVFKVEKDYISKYISKTDNLRDKLQTLEKQDTYEGKRCKFLDEDGACAVYQARPIICRSHGAPIQVAQEPKVKYDVCPLNFRDADWDRFDQNASINLSLINSLLVLINQRYDSQNSGKRYRLSVSEITPQ